MIKVFIDGSSGTTGLRIFERFKNRDDVELLRIDGDKRKDRVERARLINEADAVFLCLPDGASREAVSFCENDNTVIIDASTAFRTDPDFAYGFPELDGEFEEKIKNSKRIANPGCYASGFISIVYPLVKYGVISPDYPLVCYAMSGYSGAGKKGIAQYEDENRNAELDSPRQYALSQNHKHLKEMRYICSLERTPFFAPHICDYPSGMVVSVPLFSNMLNKKMTPGDLMEMYSEHYKNKDFVKVRPLGYSENMIGSNNFAGRDDMEIEINGNEDRILITSRFDNLGKGASGAAVECFNISFGKDKKTGLVLGE